MIKVLLCSPYLSSDDVVKGGINTWGRYILSYANKVKVKDGIEICPVSFDRKASTNISKSRISRIINALREYKTPIQEAISLMRSVKPDVAHLCTSSGLGLFRDLFLVMKARKMRVKTVVHFHFGRIPELVTKNNLEWKLLRMLIKKSDVAIVMNRPSETALLRLGFKNVEYLPNPLSTDVIDKLHSLKDKFQRIPRRLLYVGHVIKTKGVYELVEACKYLPNITLRVVGKCDYDVRIELEEMASSKDDGSWLNIVGEVSHDDILSEFLQADIFVFPSYTEGFPNVILEAMACGCPIVSSDVGAIPEMLDMGNSPCGVCFRPRSVDEIVKGVNLVINDIDLKNKLALNAMNRLETFYLMPRVWSCLTNIWKREKR